MISLLNQKVEWCKKTGKDRKGNLTHEKFGLEIKCRLAQSNRRVQNTEGNIITYDKELWSKIELQVEDLVYSGTTPMIIKEKFEWVGFNGKPFGYKYLLLKYV